MAEVYLTDTETETIQDGATTNPDPVTGLQYGIRFEEYKNKVTRQEMNFGRGALPAHMLRVYKSDAGDLRFGVRAGEWLNAGTLVSFVETEASSVSDNAKNYIYVTPSGTLTIVQTTGFPAQTTTPHIPLAEIWTGSESLTAALGYRNGIQGVTGDIYDRRGRGFLQVPGQDTKRFTMAQFGEWLIDGDGANTNGAGMVGDVTLTNAAAAFAKAWDQGTTTFANLATDSSLTGWTANFQLTADAANEEVNDAIYFGNSVPFAEIAFDLSQLATYGADAGLYEYWNGAWTDLGGAVTLWDETDITANDGKRPWQQVGAMAFAPPSDWASTTVDSQAAYWIRWRVTALQVTQEPIMNTKEHDIVTPADGATAPRGCRITKIRATDGAGTLHTTNDIIFILQNFTTGDHSGELTWAQDQQSDSWGSLTIDCSAGDSLGVVVLQEDGAAEATNVILECDI